MKTIKLALNCLLFGACSHLSAQEKADTPEAAFSQIGNQLREGESVKALSMMTEEARREFVLISVAAVSYAAAFGDEFPKKLPDGTQVNVSPADIGIDKTKFPKWMTDRSVPKPTEKEMDEFLYSLADQIEKSENKNKVLNDLFLLSESVEPSSYNGLGGKMLQRKPKGKYPEGTLWVQSHYKNGGSEKIALRFIKQKDTWKYAGWDGKSMAVELKKFVENKNLNIAGKTLAGEEISLKGLEGKVVLIDFWGTW